MYKLDKQSENRYLEGNVHQFKAKKLKSFSTFRQLCMQNRVFMGHQEIKGWDAKKLTMIGIARTFACNITGTN